MAYDSSIGAFRSLIEGKERESRGAQCWVSWSASGVKRDESGIETFSVELTCSSGIQYFIPAYGAEAKVLHKAVEASGLKPSMPLIEV